MTKSPARTYGELERSTEPFWRARQPSGGVGFDEMFIRAFGQQEYDKVIEARRLAELAKDRP